MHCLRAAVLMAVLAASAGVRGDHAAVMPYVADDVTAVAFVDVSKLNLIAIADEAASLKLLSDAEEIAGMQSAAIAQKFVAEYLKSGGQGVYVAFRNSDVVRGGTTWVIETESEATAAAVKNLLKGWLKMIPPNAMGDVSDVLPKVLRVEGNVILGGPNQARLDEVEKARRATAREDVVAALAGLAGADAGIVAFGDPDSRRVIRELWPAAPAPFAEIDGRFLADGLRSICLTLKFPPQPAATLAVAAVDENEAAVVKRAADMGLAALKAVGLSEMASGPPAHKARSAVLLPLLARLSPQVSGSTVSMSLGKDPADFSALKALIAPAIADARGAANRATRINAFKQISLAMLNYESAKKTYPAAAIRNDSGQPLLSWRVAILPYLEEQALYNEFHLDEPWNSEHNLKLVEKMPKIYQDPDATVRAAIGGGRTTFVVPIGQGTIFGGEAGMKIRDVKDGTSNTVMLVEVAPEQSVVWTKPDDWEVDFKDPLRGVKRADRDGFAAAFGDGSVMYLPNSIDPANWGRALTAAGGEVVDPF